MGAEPVMGFFSLFMILFGGASTAELLKTPPRDLASLLNARAVLQQMEVAVGEESLIAVLRQTRDGAEPVDLAKVAEDLGAAQYATRKHAAEMLKAAGEAARPHLEKAAQSDDPEVNIAAKDILKDLRARRESKLRKDDDYVSKLFAIRVLEQMKSQKAVPELEAIAQGKDVTLADAALEAIAVIKGQPSPRPGGREALKELAAMLPRNSGFVLVADLERGHGDWTLAQMFERMRKQEAGAEGMLALSFMSPDQIAPQAEKGITEALAEVGNVRIDAVVAAFSDDLDEHNGVVCVMLKGLCDPTRVQNACKRGFRNQHDSGQHTVFSSEHGPALCVLDAKTVIMTIGPADNSQQMDRVLAAIAAQPKAELPAHIARAFEMVKADDVKVAVSGTLSEGQKAQIKKEMENQIKNVGGGQEQKIELAACTLGLNLTTVGMFEGHLDPNGVLIAKANCPNKQDAEKLNLTLVALEELTRQEMSQSGDFGPLQSLLVGKDKKFWESAQEESQVTVKVNCSPMMGLFGLPWMFSLGYQVEEDIGVPVELQPEDVIMEEPPADDVPADDQPVNDDAQ